MDDEEVAVLEKAAERQTTGPPWIESFEITTIGESEPTGRIYLSQSNETKFVLGSTIRYVGTRTGLERRGLPAETASDILSVTPETLAPDTDLASVPGPLRWFLSSYGVHTPAALIHDRLIPTDEKAHPGMSDADADRFFRFMLEDLGVPILRRWLMWSAVAFRTFYMTRTWIAWLWVVTALFGIAGLVVGLASGSIPLVIAMLLAPLAASALWKRQYGAGIIAAACAPFILPPALIAALGYGVYWLLERLIGLVVSEP